VVVTLDEGDAAAFARQLVEVIRLGYLARGRTPPRLLVEVANAVSSAVRSSASGSAHPCRSGSGAELRNSAAEPFLPSCDQPVKLSAML
jgi:hypothetical protein